MPYRMRNASVQYSVVEKGTDEPANQFLAENFAKLKAGRAIGKLREEMADAGIAIGTGTLQKAAHGQVGNRLESLEKMAKFFGVTVDQLLQPDLGAGTDTEYVDVPRKKVALSAGPGRHSHLEEDIGSLKFRADFLRSVGANPGNAAVVDVIGRSMEPTIPDGAVVLVSGANKEPRDRLIFALRIGDELYVKRLVRSGASWLARSDNEDRIEFPDVPMVGDDIEVIGRAVWMGARL